MYRNLQRSHNIVLTRYSEIIVLSEDLVLCRATDHISSTNWVGKMLVRWSEKHVEEITKPAGFFVAFAKGMMFVLSKSGIVTLKYYGLFRKSS